MKKATYILNADGQVTLAYDFADFNGITRVTRTFFCPDAGGYVLEKGVGNWKQVCKRLANAGDTLMCNDRQNLLGLIRREYRAMRAEENRAICF